MNPNELLLLDEVASECRAPLSSVRRWISSGRLRSIRPAKRRLVYRRDLQRFLESGGATLDEPSDHPEKIGSTESLKSIIKRTVPDFSSLTSNKGEADKE